MKDGVKIRIHGLHSPDTIDIPEDHLPWAQCVLPLPKVEYRVSVRYLVFCPVALVFGLFMDGKNSQIPIIFGSLPKGIEKSF